ncbi:DNA-binding protein BIN4 [Bienertia sinuspersici]
MGDSREGSPDWLRSFQPPTQSITTLSSDSEPSGDKSPARDDSTDLQRDTQHRKRNLPEEDEEDDDKICDIVMKSPTKKSPAKKKTKKHVKGGNETPAKRRKTEKLEKKGSEDDVIKREDIFDDSTETPATAPDHSICELSSDSGSDFDPKEEKEKSDVEETAPKRAVKGKSPKKRVKQGNVQPTGKKETTESVKIEADSGHMDASEDGKPAKQTVPVGNSSTLPLVLPEKIHRSKALVECEGESIDLSGDMGAVGRVIISETSSKESEMFLDLKGTIYKTVIVPSRTFCVVSVGQSEAKIEAVMNDFIQLKPQSNVYDSETMVEGTMEGFTFDSDDEADKMTKDVNGDKNEGAEEQPNKKTKGKAEKKSVKPGATKKKGKDVGGKQPKRRKPQAPKKGKAKK